MSDWIKNTARWMAKILFRVKLVGELSVFNQKKLLIIANHASFLDGPLLALFLPVQPLFIVHPSVLRNSFQRFFLRFCDYLPIDSTQPLAIKKILAMIETGRPVVIFPEGRVTNTGSLMKIYEGPAFIAAKSGACIIPIQCDGTLLSYFTRMPDSHPRQFFPKVTLTILPCFTLRLPTTGSAREKRKHASEEIRRLMQKMIFATTDVEGSLYQHLLKTITLFGKKYSLLEDIHQTEIHYGMFLKMIIALAHMTRRLTTREEKVGILLPNLTSTAALFFALNAQGRIPALLNFSAGLHNLQSACIAADIHTIFTSRQFLEKAKLTEVAQQLENVRLIYLEDLRTAFRWRDKLAVLLSLLHPESIHHPTEVAVVLFTSGSEGQPKGVALSHRALLSNIAQLKSVISFSPEDKMFNALPMFHAFGLTVGTLLPLLQGLKLFIYPTPLHYRFIPEFVYDRNCTILAGTNTFLAKYAQFAHPYDFYSLRYVVAGAEKLAESTKNIWLEKFGLRILEGYGATEAAPTISANTPMAYRAGTVGEFLPGIQYHLEPVEGIQEGQLLFIQGPNLMMGYYRVNQPGVLQQTQSPLGPAWHETGDIVTIDEDGFLKIVGRLKRFAKIAGEMISLDLVERIAHHASPEKIHAAISVEDEKRGEQIILFTTDKTLNRQRMLESLHTLHLPELCLPRRIITEESLPLLGSGKPDYMALKSSFAKPPTLPAP